MKIKQRTVWTLTRVAILLAFLAGVGVLYQWSRAGDPRFFVFLDSAPGRALSTVFNWENIPRLRRIDESKPLKEWSQKDRALLEELQQLLASSQPTHRVILKDGKQLFGILLGRDDDHFLFQESYGTSGTLSVKIAKKRIDRIAKLKLTVPDVTYRDVRFRREFPNMQFYKRPPFTIMTDESYFRVEHVVRELQRLRGDIVDLFGPLMSDEVADDNIQVLFFSAAEDFSRYQRKNAPHIEHGTGFYSPVLDRLVVFNQKTSEKVDAFYKQLDAAEASYEARASQYGGIERIRNWRKQSHRKLMRLAEQETRQTIRHEGAHQLLFTFGIHSAHRIENDWLVEGLATYCELPSPGDLEGGRISQVKNAIATGSHIPVDELVNTRSMHGLFSRKDGDVVSLAYAEAWSLVHMLFEGETREDFISYIAYLRDPENLSAVRKVDRFDLLCRFLGMPEWELRERWENYMTIL